MKTFQLILIFTILGSCFTQDDDECSTKFESILQQKCTSINTTNCRFTNNDNERCLPKNSCGSAGTYSDCSKLIPENYHTKKCSWKLKEEGGSVYECKEVDKICTDYNQPINGIQISGDICGDLKANSADEKCQLYWDVPTSMYKCTSHFKLCSKASGSADICNNNIPDVSSTKCFYDNTKSPAECTTRPRSCSYTDSIIFRDMAEDICPSLQLQQSTGTKCIYLGGTCQEKYILCSGYFISGNENACNSEFPLNQTGKDYDNENKCQYVEGTGGSSDNCISVKRTCSQFTGSDALTCTHLTSTNSNKRCVYDGNCRPEYTTCELYSNNEIEKDRDGCEGLIMLEENKKCVYIPEEDKCETRQIYENCESYEGSDRKICESIISPTTNSYCILDKDSKCKDRVPYCSEIEDGNLDDCIYYAKPKDPNKRCAYNDTTTPTTGTGGTSTTPTGPRCYEEYARCEDYLGNDTQICEEIRLYNGIACEFVSGRCRSTNKICEEALTEEECKLINETGVTDTDKKVCDYIGSSCIENYKYCSDFREIRTEPDVVTYPTEHAEYITFTKTCTNIKPYDESGKNKDIYSKCIYESGVGCQRVPKDCGDSDIINNPILCNLISPKIKDNSVKHCVFYQGQCKEHFKKCEDVNDISSKCLNNIIENYIVNECEVDSSNKCARKKSCTSFDEGNYEELCKSINPNCTYSSGICKAEDKSCTEIKFYTESEGNEAICKSIKVDEPYMMCSLREDKKGCEIIYKESRYSLGASTQQDNTSSTGFLSKRIHLVLIFIFFLF